MGRAAWIIVGWCLGGWSMYGSEKKGYFPCWRSWMVLLGVAVE